MATVNLGAIKFNWKGAYNNSTQYQVDDVVSSGGSSYICILASQGNAVSNGTYWNQMSAAGTNGTNGTDVGTVITTQGDMLYRDGSGLQRLAKGTAGQVLLMNSGATAPQWGTGGEKNTPIVIAYLDGTQGFSSGAGTKITYDATIVNTDNVFNTSTHRFTPNVAGYYHIKGSMGHGAYSGGTNIHIKFNGSGNHYIVDENVSGAYTVFGSKILYFNGTSDYADFYGYFAGGATISGNSTTASTRLEIHRIIT